MVGKSIQIEVRDLSREDEALTLLKKGKRAVLWLETEDGEASVLMTEEEFKNLYVKTCTLMRWSF